ncbi:MAG TPA: hypothetical protein ENJ82_03605 [Bacteroidetes bacterium]|nr:hypothetical protein [Bacteroidota bacterium]
MASIQYPIQVNGKVRYKMEFPAGTGKDAIEKAVLADTQVIALMGGKTLRKIIVVPGRIVNIVI